MSLMTSHSVGHVCGRSRPMLPPRSRAGTLSLPGDFVGWQRAGHVCGMGATTSRGDFWSNTREAIASARQSRGPRRHVTRMMPIGVPKVPFRTPREGGWQWVDLWNCLYRERLIFLSKPVDDELGNQLVATMLYLDSEEKKDMQLYINCMGGDVVPCLAIFDTMKYIKSKVGTVGFGACMGMSGFLLAIGAKGKRFVLPNTRIMLHHPSGSARGQASDIQNESRELLRLRNYVNRVLSDATSKPIERIQHDFNRNKYFSVEEAKEYGLIDSVLRPPKVNVMV